MPDASSAFSPSRCQRPSASPRSSSAPRTESLTTCFTPARFAASIALPSSCGRASPVASKKTLSTPAKAAARLSGLARSPFATSTSPAYRAARSGLRVRIRTGWSAARSCVTTSLPMVPVAPVTRSMMATRPDRRRGGSDRPVVAVSPHQPRVRTLLRAGPRQLRRAGQLYFAHRAVNCGLSLEVLCGWVTSSAPRPNRWSRPRVDAPMCRASMPGHGGGAWPHVVQRPQARRGARATGDAIRFNPRCLVTWTASAADTVNGDSTRRSGDRAHGCFFLVGIGPGHGASRASRLGTRSGAAMRRRA